MLINSFLPEYQFSKLHKITVDAPPHVVYEALLTANIIESSLIKVLFRARGLPATKMTLEDMQKMGFAKLGEVPNKELVLGLAGRFWTLNGDLQPIEPSAFSAFNKSGFAKAAWNFSLDEAGKNRTVLQTETRIQCLDKKSYSRFRLYWLLISPFSSVIRREILNIVKRQSETSPSLFAD